MTFNVKIKIERKVGTNTDVGEGVRKGDGVPSVLFNLVLEMVLKELKLKLISCKTKQVHVYPEAKAFCKNNQHLFIRCSELLKMQVENEC